MIFEKLDGGTLLHNIWRRGLLREHDVSEIVKNIADGLFFLHQKGKTDCNLVVERPNSTNFVFEFRLMR